MNVKLMDFKPVCGRERADRWQISAFLWWQQINDQNMDWRSRNVDEENEFLGSIVTH